MKENRVNLRVKLGVPVEGSLEYDDVKPILINDFSAAGIGFSTSEVLDIGLVASINFTIGHKMTMIGRIIRREVISKTYHYGFESLLNETEKTPWVKLINQLNLKNGRVQ